MPETSTSGDPEGFAYRGVVTVCLMVATLMQALDTTIANVALPYMQGSLSTSYDQITWVLTTYVIAAAVMTAPVGWLAARYGRKNLLIVCLVGFTLASMLCGIANTLVEMVVYRVIQGAFGAALLPLSQSTMIDIYPPKQRGMAMSVWGMGVMVGPIMGPTLGGYLTSAYDWRYVFYVNLPFGILATLGLIFLMPKGTGRRGPQFDWFGFGVLALGLLGMQVALDRGEELDWFSSRTIIACATLSALGYYLFVVHMVTARNPFFPRAIFKDRNFVASLLTIFSVGVVLLAASALLAPYLENLGNYPVATAGLLMGPRGFGTMAAMLLAGRLTDRIDPRLMIAAGYALILVGIYLQEGWTPAESIPDMMAVIILQGAGIGLVFVPLQVVAFYTLPAELRTQGSALLSLLRNVGAAIGIAVSSAVLDRQSHYEHAVLAQGVTPFARPLQAGGAVTRLLSPAHPGGASLLNSIIDTQAQIIAYVDDYKLLFLVVLPSMLCLLLIQGRPRQPPTARETADAAAAMD